MTWIVWLLVCFATGIVWADGRDAPGGGFVWLGLGASLAAIAIGALAVRAGLPRRSGSRAPRRASRAADPLAIRIGGRGRLGRGMALGWIGLLGLAAGHDRHASMLERARRGAASAAERAAVEVDRVHRIDARVAARRTRAGGDEIELWAVREADGHAAGEPERGTERVLERGPEARPRRLPERLVLRLSPTADERRAAPNDRPSACDTALASWGGAPAAREEAAAAKEEAPAAKKEEAPAARAEAPEAKRKARATANPMRAVGDDGENGGDGYAWSTNESAHCGDGRAISGCATRADALLWPGARVRLAVRIAPLRPTRNPGSPDRAHAYARRGIGARARLLDPDWVVEVVPERPGLARTAAALASMRRAGQAEARRRLPSCRPGAGLVRALALGDRAGLDAGTRRRFSALGLAHLLSVSGLHVGFVAWPIGAGVARLRTRLGSRRQSLLDFRVPLLAAGLAGGAYAWLTGGNVPALRASACFALLAAARGLRIAPRPGGLLALVGLGLLVGEPDRLFAPGARFSFVACTALIGAGLWAESGASSRAASRPGMALDRDATPGWARGRPLRVGESRWRRFVLAPFSASLAVSLALLPLTELEGLPRAWPSPWINLFAIPWTGLVLLPCALGAVVGLAVVPASWGDAWLAPLVAPAALLEWAVAGVDAALDEHLPATLTEPDRAGGLPWSVGLASVGVGLMALRCGRLVRAAAIWLVVGGLGLAPLRERSFGETRPRVVFFDVGQADAALIESGDAAWLIDSGGGPADGSGGGTVLRALRALGVERLDGLVISHGDLDHRGGALRLLGAMSVGVLWLPALSTPDPALAPLVQAARRRGIPVEWMHAGMQRASGAALELEVLWPPAPPCGRAARDGADRGRCAAGDARSTGVLDGGRDARSTGVLDGGRNARSTGVLDGGRNARSLVLQARIAGRTVLFPADVGEGVERHLIRSGALAPVDLLKVAHHGSRSSSHSAWLRVLVPTLAVVSAPCDATRGLPSPAVLARLRAVGSTIAWTGRDGAIAVGWDTSGEPRAWPYASTRDCEVSSVVARAGVREREERPTSARAASIGPMGSRVDPPPAR